MSDAVAYLGVDHEEERAGCLPLLVSPGGLRFPGGCVCFVPMSGSVSLARSVLADDFS